MVNLQVKAVAAKLEILDIGQFLFGLAQFVEAAGDLALGDELREVGQASRERGTSVAEKLQFDAEGRFIPPPDFSYFDYAHQTGIPLKREAEHRRRREREEAKRRRLVALREHMKERGEL